MKIADLLIGDLSDEAAALRTERAVLRELLSVALEQLHADAATLTRQRQAIEHLVDECRRLHALLLREGEAA